MSESSSLRSVDIGAAGPDELDGLLSLWTTVFECSKELFEAQYHAVEESARKSFRVVDNGKIVSSVQLYILPVYDEDLVSTPVGAIANVSTLPEARGHGYATELLNMALDEMASQGCGWSFLYTGIPPFYARMGWESVIGEAALVDLEGFHWVGPKAKVLEMSPELLARLETLWKLGSRAPLELARTGKDWSEKLAYRLSKVVLLEIEGCGVVVAAAQEGDELRVDQIFGDPMVAAGSMGWSIVANSVADYAQCGNLTYVVWRGRLEPELRVALEGLNAQLKSLDLGMVRAISPDWSAARLRALFSRPGLRFSFLDAF